MTEIFGVPREAVRVKVKKCETRHQPEYRKFSVDPQITSIEVLQSILVKAFDIKGDFTVSYRAIDDYGSETYLFLLSDWDLDAAFISASEPYLYLRVNLKPFGETGDCDCDWEQNARYPIVRHAETGFSQKAPKLQGLIMNKMERTLNLVQRALSNLGDESNRQNQQQQHHSQHQAQQKLVTPPAPFAATSSRPPLTDAEFRRFLDPVGQVIDSRELRAVIYFGGVEPSLRKVVWKHILNVYPEGMSGRERMDYMRRKAEEYRDLRDRWRTLVQSGRNVGELGYVTSMVRKDVLRTDRHHKFYAGSDDNQNTASLFNILTTYALNHPSVSYCQGMSDLASPLLVTMRDEAQAYICLCALMNRLRDNFMLDGIAMTTKFAHLAEGLQHYDPDFYAYLKSHQADDLLFCYRWLLLEMKREFALEDALGMLEVSWAALPASPPKEELALAEIPFPPPTPPPLSPKPKHAPRENAYTKVCAIRRQSSSASIAGAANPASSATTGSCCKNGRSSNEEQQSVAPASLGSTAENGEETKGSTGTTTSSPSSYQGSSEPETEDATSAKNRKNSNGDRSTSTSNSDLSQALRNNKNRTSTTITATTATKTITAAAAASASRERPLARNANEINKKCSRVVKNLNEFLNFANLNRRKNESRDDNDNNDRANDDRVGGDEIGDGSPDDTTEFFPMTTSMTRELRLELESLDRQVFGRSSMNVDDDDDDNDEEVDVVGEIGAVENEEKLSRSGANLAMTSRRTEGGDTIESETETDVARCSPAADVFVWENPLHALQTLTSATTPDEQAELEYDGEILEEQNGVKSVTPIRLLKRVARSTSGSDSETIDSNWRGTDRCATDSERTSSRACAQEQCEEATESPSAITAGIIDNGDDQLSTINWLPPPREFGGGNPFLMFLCITLLLQHRDFVMRNRMDYNEMAMHFDKMVRRHNVTRVLNQARQLFAGYLRKHSAASSGRGDFVSV